MDSLMYFEQWFSCRAIQFQSLRHKSRTGLRIFCTLPPPPKRERERERGGGSDRDRRAGRERERQTDRQTGRQAERERERERENQGGESLKGKKTFHSLHENLSA